MPSPLIMMCLDAQSASSSLQSSSPYCLKSEEELKAASSTSTFVDLDLPLVSIADTSTNSNDEASLTSQTSNWDSTTQTYTSTPGTLLVDEPAFLFSPDAQDPDQPADVTFTLESSSLDSALNETGETSAVVRTVPLSYPTGLLSSTGSVRLPKPFLDTVTASSSSSSSSSFSSFSSSASSSSFPLLAARCWTDDEYSAVLVDSADAPLASNPPLTDLVARYALSEPDRCHGTTAHDQPTSSLHSALSSFASLGANTINLFHSHMPLQQPQQPSAPYPSTSQPNMSLTMSNMPLSGAHPAPYGAMPVKPELANPAYYMNAFPPGGAPPPVQGGQMQLQQQPFQQLQQQQQPQLLSNPAYPTYLPPANVQYTGVASSVASAASASTAPGQASQQRQRASASASSGGQGSDEGDGSDGEGGEDGEDDGVWTKEVEDAFEEAFALYPPCGRRKIILNNEGKMFGRNELIARYIRMKTGKGRSRKQVSSHIQVIARKRQREIGERLKHCNQDMQRAAMENLATMSSAQLVSATLNPQAQVAAAAAQPYAEPITLPAATSAAALSAQMQRESLGTILQAVDAEAPASTSPQLSHQHPVTFSASGAAPRDGPPAPRHQPNQVTLCQLASALEYPNLSIPPVFFVNIENEVLNDPQMEIVEAKLIADKFPQLRERFAQNPAGGFYLIKFWTELPGNMPQAFGFYPSSYWMTARFESQEQITLEVTRSVVSFGKTAQTKTVYLLSSGVLNGKHQYYMMQQPLCEYMQTFIEKLRGLPSRELMNNVLENFSASITVANAATKEVLLNLALIFEVISDDTGSQHNVYRLVDSQ